MNDKTKIALQSNRGLKLVQQNDILYALADGNYTQIYLVNEGDIRILKKLKAVAKLLPSENFTRIHRSHLVNMTHVKMFNQGKKVVMSDGKTLAVARSCKHDFKQKFIQL